jgi:metal-responsive CopG/Arc/MetJ family transcriptional regulator
MKEVIMMRATLNIPDDLVEEVLKVSGEKSKTRAIVAAMKSYIRRTKLTELKALRGQIAIDYDWKKEEEMEIKAEEERSRSLEK